MCKGEESHPLMEAGLSTQAEMYIPEHTHTHVCVCVLSLSLTHTHTHTHLPNPWRVSNVLSVEKLYDLMCTRHPWTKKFGGLQSLGLRRVGHNWATKHRTQAQHTHTHTHTVTQNRGTEPAEPRPLHQCTLAPWLRFPRPPCLPLKSQCVLVAQLCPTLCDPMDYRLPSSFVHGIL